MFTLPYFYFFLATVFFTFTMQRAIQHGQLSEKLSAICSIVYPACTLAYVVFLILGFWYMPHWWYPLAFYVISFLTSFIPIPDKIAATLGVVIAPICTVLMYLSLFQII